MKPFALLVLFCAAAVCMAESDTAESSYSKTTKTRYTNYIGFAGGFTTGYGISFREWFSPKWAFQINLFPYYQETRYPDRNNMMYYTDADSGYSNEGTLSLGLTLLHSIAEAKYIRFLSYAGANDLVNYRKYDMYTRQFDNWNGYEYDTSYARSAGRTYTNLITLGGGCGIEFFVWRLSFHAMIGLRGTYEIPTNAKSVGPTIEGGIHFRY